MKKTLLSFASTTALFLSANTAMAQDAENVLVLDEVITYAQKKPETAQSVPIAINAYSGDFVEKASIDDIGDLVAYTPGLAGDNYQDTESVFTVRGIGTSAFGVGADTSVGIFIDDIYQGRTVNAGNSFFDVERVEVVKGPQGTLFGRNTAAGAISITTHKPDLGETYFDAKVGFGDKGQQLYEGIANIGMSDTTGLRAAIRYDKRDGPFHNTADGQELNNREHLSARVTFSNDWSDTARSVLTGEYFTADSHTGAISLAGTPEADVDLIPNSVTQNVSKSQDIDSVKLSLRNEFDLNDAITLTAITGYIDTSLVSVPIDVDTLDLNVLYLSEPQDIEQFSQEVRLTGTQGAADWLLGASVSLEDITGTTTYNFDDDAILLALAGVVCADLGLFPPDCVTNAQEEGFANSDNTSWGIYGNLNYDLTDQLSVTLGGRYSHDKKEFTHLALPTMSGTTTFVLGGNLFKPPTGGPLTGSESWGEFTYRAGLDYQVTPDVLLYGSFATGYKAGGFNSIGDFTNPANPVLSQFDPEKNEAFEAGLKADIADGRGRINFAAYKNNYDNYQVETTMDGFQVFIQNAAKAKSQGFEIDGRFLASENLELFGSYSYVDTEFKSGMAFNGLTETLDDLTGNVLPRAPKNMLNLGAEVTFPITNIGDASLRGTYSNIGKQFYDPFQQVAFSERSYDLVNLRAALADDGGVWELALIGENITDERYFGTKALGLTPIGIPNMGSLFRVELGVHF